MADEKQPQQILAREESEVACRLSDRLPIQPHPTKHFVLDLHQILGIEEQSALLEHPAVAESAVVAKPDFVNMEVVKAFVTLKPGYIASKDLDLEIMNFVRKKLSPLAMPQEIEFIDACPRPAAARS